jgi:site-specific DNA-methyltransferase (adenine-specific)
MKLNSNTADNSTAAPLLGMQCYQPPSSIVFFEDCVEGMKRFPDNHFDLAICDPEYGIGASKPSKKPNRAKQKNGAVLNVKSPTYNHKDWDNKPAGKEYFDELFRVSKHQIIWGSNFYDYKFPSSGRIVWDKLNGESDQMGCEIAYCSLNNRTDIVYFMWAGMFQGIYCGKDIRKALIQQGNKQLNEKRIHPTQKPISLYKWLLNEYATAGMKILDTHLGSGSHRIAAYEYGFNFTAFENDKEYYDSQELRFREHSKQHRLF